MNFLKRNWKTTVGSFIYIVGVGIEFALDPTTGKVIQGVGVGIVGLNARDAK